MKHRLKLLPYAGQSTRDRCPSCGKAKELVPYLDTETGEILPPEYGRCNREGKCAYHLSPYEKDANGVSYYSALLESERTATALLAPKIRTRARVQTQTKKIYIPTSVAQSTLKKDYYEKNAFAQFILNLCKDEATRERAIRVLQDYKVGTCSEGTIFWFVDSQNNTQAGQVKKFSDNCKTQKTTWIHSVLQKQGKAFDWLPAYLDQDSKFTCLFGEHLLALPANKDKTIVLGESPKNAIFASIFLPANDFLFLAAYSLSTFTMERCKEIIGKKILLLPDLGKATEVWKESASKFLPEGSYDFLYILEKVATDLDRENGSDIADFLIKELTQSTTLISHSEYMAQLFTSADRVQIRKTSEIEYPAAWDFQDENLTQETKQYLCRL
jgi:hypothetical protein